MARKRRTEPRKTPAQPRGYQTIDRILDETAHILETNGYLGLNTNAIASAAGLSVGSVYQYFPNKESIITALAARSLDQATDRIVDCLEQPELACASIESVIRATIDVALDAIDTSRLHSLLALEAGRSSALDAATDRFDRRTAAALAVHVRRHEPVCDDGDAELRSRLAIAAADAALHRVVLALAEPERPDAVDMLVSMVTQMLVVPRRSPLAGTAPSARES